MITYFSFFPEPTENSKKGSVKKSYYMDNKSKKKSFLHLSRSVGPHRNPARAFDSSARKGEVNIATAGAWAPLKLYPRQATFFHLRHWIIAK